MICSTQAGFLIFSLRKTLMRWLETWEMKPKVMVFQIIFNHSFPISMTEWRNHWKLYFVSLQLVKLWELELVSSLVLSTLLLSIGSILGQGMLWSMSQTNSCNRLILKVNNWDKKLLLTWLKLICQLTQQTKNSEKCKEEITTLLQNLSWSWFHSIKHCLRIKKVKLTDKSKDIL